MVGVQGGSALDRNLDILDLVPNALVPLITRPLGSDWDGAITPPRDLQTPLELPRLAQIMLDRGWKPARIHKILAGNFLRALEQLRG